MMGLQRSICAPCVLALLLLAALPPADAASEQTCREYASHAVDVARRGKSVPCPLGDPGGRWSTQFNDHFNWCRTVKDRTLDEENVARDTLVSACSRDHASCQRYADQAVAQFKRIGDLRCEAVRSPPGRWSLNNRSHYDWCRQAISKSERLGVEADERAKVVTRCERCDLYAKGAVASAERLFAKGCGGVAYGDRWSRSYEGHRAWCLKVRESTQDSEDSARVNLLNTCEQGTAAGAGGSTANPSPPTATPCNVTATLEVYQCKNTDGSTSDYFTRTDNLTACGTSKENAEASAARLFNGCLGDEANCCQYRATHATGACACTFPPGTVSSGLSVPKNIWSAFATNGRGGWGYASNQPDLKTANSLALQGCGGPGNSCRVFATSTGYCNAFAESRPGGYWFAAGSGTTEAIATANAIRFCQSGPAPAGSCRIAKAWCR